MQTILRGTIKGEKHKVNQLISFDDAKTSIDVMRHDLQTYYGWTNITLISGNKHKFTYWEDVRKRAEAEKRK